MKHFTFILLITICFTLPSIAQDTCPCCTKHHQAFDFWVGDWEVFDTLGVKIGENLVEKLEDNCILNENWNGSGGSTGKSYNYFNRQDSTWNQLWIDNTGNQLILKGKGSKNQMVMTSALQPGQNVEFYANRITWTLQPDASVTQVWDVIDNKGSLLTQLFYGIYKKK